MFLNMTGIDKSFGANMALDSAAFGVDRGEVVALIGANGAGKSTLVKIMTGIHGRDAGTVRVEGRPVAIASPREAMELGIRMIPQELSVLPDLSVAENVFLGAMPARGGGPLATVRFAEMAERAGALLESLGLGRRIDPRRTLREFGTAERRLVEIARALAGRARILVMDEPTASLSEPERARLFGIMRRLAAGGTGIVFISHYLDEVFRISDRIVVLRDGVNSGNFRTAETDHGAVLAAMLGKEPENLFPPYAKSPGKARLEASGLRDGGALLGVDLSARAGEIHGAFGLVGSGVEDLGKALFGARAPAGGTVTLGGAAFLPRSAAEAVAAGVGFVSGERRAEGVVPAMSVRDNFTLPFLRRHSRGLTVSRRSQYGFASRWMDGLGVRATGVEQPIDGLSGGNQQKVCIGRWLIEDLAVLILEEPTRGVDIGARQDIYRHLRRLSDGGLCVVVISSDAEEIAGLSDSVTILREGWSVARFDRPQGAETLMRAGGTALAA